MLCFMQNGVIVLPYLSTIRERIQEHLDGNAFNIAALNPAHAIMQKWVPHDQARQLNIFSIKIH